MTNFKELRMYVRYRPLSVHTHNVSLTSQTHYSRSSFLEYYKQVEHFLEGHYVWPMDHFAWPMDHFAWPMDHFAVHQQSPLLILKEQILFVDPALMMSVG